MARETETLDARDPEIPHVLRDALLAELRHRMGHDADTITLPALSAKQWRALVTTHSTWRDWMRALGTNSGALTKKQAMALAVVMRESCTYAPEGEAPEGEAPEGEAPEGEAPGHDEARALMKRIFGHLGEGDMTAVDAAVREVIDARDKLAADLDAAKRQATAAAVASTQPAPGQQVTGGAAQPAGEITVGDLMPRAGTKTLTDRMATRTLTTWTGGGTPDPDPHYAPDPAALEALCACDLRGANLWLYGPAGTGKSSLPEWYAARLGRPFYRIACDRSTEPEDLIGGLEPRGDAFEWRDGALAQAIRTPGAVVLIDEPTLARPTALAMLQTLLDGGRSVLARATGEVIRCAPGVLFVAADNTSGTGDETGQYAGTSAMNRAFLDRMAARQYVGYMPETAETAVLAKRSGLAKDACKIMVKFANGTRKSAANGDMAHGLGLRRLIAWAGLVAIGIPSERAFISTCVQGEAPDDAETVKQMANGYLDHNAIDALA